MPSDEDYEDMVKGRGNKVYNICPKCGMKFYTVDAHIGHTCTTPTIHKPAYYGDKGKLA